MNVGFCRQSASPLCNFVIQRVPICPCPDGQGRLNGTCEPSHRFGAYNHASDETTDANAILTISHFLLTIALYPSRLRAAGNAKPGRKAVAGERGGDGRQ